MKHNKIKVISFSVFVLLFSLIMIFGPKSDISFGERRKLAVFPEISLKNITSGKFMSGFESYFLDHFPGRDKLRSIKSVSEFYLFSKNDYQKLYIENGYISKLEYPIREKSVEHASKKFNAVYNKYLSSGNFNVYFSIIPDKNYFLTPENNYPSIDYEKFIDIFKEKNSFMKYIDITETLDISDYYRTDTHWKQENLIETANKLALGMNIELNEEYEKIKVNAPFYGVYHGQSALPLKPDEIYYLTNETIENCTVFNFEENKEMSVYDLSKSDSDDPYEIFLSGPLSLITIENKNAESDRELIIFRDSFGSSIAPLFIEAYSKITLVDIRYISSEVLDRFISFENQDILFLYSTLVLNNAETIK